MSAIIATIDTAHYGLRDFPDGRPGLWFDVEWNGGCTFYAYTHDEAEKFLIENQIIDISELNGMACIVDPTGPGCSPVKFVKLLGIVEKLDKHPLHKICPQCEQYRDADDGYCGKCGVALIFRRIGEAL